MSQPTNPEVPAAFAAEFARVWDACERRAMTVDELVARINALPVTEESKLHRPAVDAVAKLYEERDAAVAGWRAARAEVEELRRVVNGLTTRLGGLM